MSITYTEWFKIFDHGCLNDIINEIADNYVPCDRIAYLLDHVKDAEEMINEGMFDGLYDYDERGVFHLQSFLADLGEETARYNMKKQITNNLHECLATCICHYYDLDKLTPEQDNYLKNNIDRFETIEEVLNNLMFAKEN